ncbi:MAG: hypothetical protein GC154_20675 [bacterium]|nr:hypothetical protein [bacterium]
MNTRINEQMRGWVRVYWQPAIYGLLGFILLIQFGVYGYRWLELRSIDSLIASAENADPAPGAGDSKPGENSGGPGNPGGPGMPGGPGNPGEERKPEKDIFRKEEVKYQLTAIYFDKAVINGQEVAVGGRVGKATLDEIDGFSVIISEEGSDQSKRLEMFTGQDGGGGSPVNRGGGPSSRGGISRPRPSSPPPSNSSRRVSNDGGSSGIPDDIRERLRSMSPDERRRAFESLPPDVRERIMQRRGNRGG